MCPALRNRALAAVVAVLVLGSSALHAQGGRKVDVDLALPKEALHAQMRELAVAIDALRGTPALAPGVEMLQARYDAIRRWLGGDEPVSVRAAQWPALAPAAGGAPLLLSAPSCGPPLTTTSFPGVGGPILTPTTPPPFTGTTFTCAVSAVGSYLWDVDLTTFIAHTDCSDLDVTLESPAGTIVTITTDNGSANDNCFNGTLWDENVNAPCTDFVYANNVTATPLSSEGRLAAFRGEDPNGTWTLRILDDLNIDTGTLTGWSLDVTTLAAPPIETTTTITESPGLPIPDASNMPRAMLFSGPGTYLSKVTLYLEIPHTDCSDLDITLTSPAGTTVKVTTDNGGTFDNCFNGTVFDPDALVPATDHVYADNVVLPQAAPEGSFDNFLGQNPNGIWILVITDDLATDVGTLARWDLSFTTIPPPVPSAPANFAGAAGPIQDNPGTPPPVPNPTVFTTVVSGVGGSLWDVDLSTAITHTSSADLDMTLTSPAGTVVVITTDNGGTLDNTFNGTLWDDNVNDGAVDHAYTNNVAVATLSPEGRLDAFRGENPNGIWTLTVTDDALADNGTLASWSVTVSTLASAPAEVSTTLTRSPALAIPDVMTVNDVMPVSGLGTNVTEVELFVQITHTFAGDLDLFLISPAGTIVPFTTDNGVGADNSFNGTLFDADEPITVTDAVYVNFVALPLLSPEGSFANFKGQDPNGNWTLRITDDQGADVGLLHRWDLTLRTCSTGSFNPFCAGDGTLTDHTTPCPCGNNGTGGNGCANSVNPGGANLSAVGAPAADNVVLQGSGMPATVSCIYLQGTALDDATFGDGTRCTGGTLLRLRTRANVGGASTFPDSTDTVTLSQRGGVTPGSGARRYYQTYYRNSAALFCPPETFNVTNGWVVDW